MVARDLSVCSFYLSFYVSVSTITKVYSIEEVIRTQGSGKDNSFSGIVYALLMSLNIDNDPARVVSFRW